MNERRQLGLLPLPLMSYTTAGSPEGLTRLLATRSLVVVVFAVSMVVAACACS